MAAKERENFKRNSETTDDSYEGEDDEFYDPGDPPPTDEADDIF